MAKKKALILTAGGGRGAYHLGALRRLEEVGWLRMDELPAYIAGTSIGSVHATALVQGLSPERLRAAWAEVMTSELVQEADGPEPMRSVLHMLLHRDLTPEPDPDVLGGSGQGGLSLPAMLSELVDRPARALLDSLMQNPHLYRSNWFGVLRALGPEMTAFDRVNRPDAPTLIVPAVDVCRGTKRVFCNKEYRDWLGAVQPATAFGPEHLNASASIQMVYPFGSVFEPAEGEARPYWDGAVADATPLDALLDVARGRGDRFEDLDIVAVLLSPWHRPGDEEIPWPTRLYETFTPALDWMMLAPFNVALKRLTDQGLALPRIIAPSAGFWKDQMALDRVVEYKPALHERLAARGYDDALAVFPG